MECSSHDLHTLFVYVAILLYLVCTDSTPTIVDSRQLFTIVALFVLYVLSLLLLDIPPRSMDGRGPNEPHQPSFFIIIDDVVC